MKKIIVILFILSGCTSGNGSKDATGKSPNLNCEGDMVNISLTEKNV